MTAPAGSPGKHVDDAQATPAHQHTLVQQQLQLPIEAAGQKDARLCSKHEYSSGAEWDQHAIVQEQLHLPIKAVGKFPSAAPAALRSCREWHGKCP